jgi:hypothetical protein
VVVVVVVVFMVVVIGILLVALLLAAPPPLWHVIARSLRQQALEQAHRIVVHPAAHGMRLQRCQHLVKAPVLEQ